MMLVSTQDAVVGGGIMGMSEIEAKGALSRLFDQMSKASQEFLLGVAMDLAVEDPAPKKSQPASKAPALLQLVVV